MLKQYWQYQDKVSDYCLYFCLIVNINIGGGGCFTRFTQYILQYVVMILRQRTHHWNDSICGHPSFYCENLYQQVICTTPKVATVQGTLSKRMPAFCVAFQSCFSNSSKYLAHTLKDDFYSTGKFKGFFRFLRAHTWGDRWYVTSTQVAKFTAS